MRDFMFGKKFFCIPALALFAVMVFAGVKADATSPAFNHAIDTTVEPVFGGPIPSAMRGGTWKVIYSSAEGPEGRALEVLTKRVGTYILREAHFATPFVLPLEKDGGPRVDTKRDAIVIGVPERNKTVKALLGGKSVPVGGYLIRTMHKEGRNVVLIAGDTPSAVLWGVFDFLDVIVPDLEVRMAGTHGGYPGTFYRGAKIPDFEYATSPETPVRSAWMWGHVINDYNDSFREMARSRFNRAIIWNDRQIVNAKQVVECAHSWGIEIYWGFHWGWGIEFNDISKLDQLSEAIVEEWRQIWKPMGGDGIYFQSFTETSKQEMGGRLIADIVTELVNKTTKKIRAESPETEIIFGLHASSIHKPGATEAIARTDPSLEILWEDCGAFPFHDGGLSTNMITYCDEILALTPSVGFCWKAQLRIDWGHFRRPLAGPFMLGCAGERLTERDRAITLPRHAPLDEYWIKNGKWAYDFVRHVREGKHQPKEFSAVAEYNPPYSFATHCQAELFWSTKDSWDDITRRARARARPER
ncbi:MAG: hypothetical protein IJU44_06195 [Kiritimatiellae bacterium]|nr:hypothetical protein [Kiritimatiellia bacterium]